MRRSRLGYLLIERLRPVKAEQSEVVDENYSALAFRIHRVDLCHHISDRLGHIIDIDQEIAEFGNALFEYTPILDLGLVDMLRSHIGGCNKESLDDFFVTAEGADQVRVLYRLVEVPTRQLPDGIGYGFVAKVGKIC